MIYFDKNKQAYYDKTEDCICEITEEEWNKITPSDRCGIEWDIQNGEFILLKETDEYIERKNTEEKEAEERNIKLLKLTRGDVLRGLLKGKGITKTDISNLILQLPENTKEEKLTKQLAIIDFEDSLEFYRGNSLVDVIGKMLGITPEQLTDFFKTNDYKKLINEEENETDNGNNTN